MGVLDNFLTGPPPEGTPTPPPTGGSVLDALMGAAPTTGGGFEGVQGGGSSSAALLGGLEALLSGRPELARRSDNIEDIRHVDPYGGADKPGEGYGADYARLLEMEKRRELARARLDALMRQGQAMQGKRAVTFADQNPEHRLPLLGAAMFPPLGVPAYLAASAYQGTADPTVNMAEAKGAAAGAGMSVLPTSAGAVAGTAAAAAASPSGPGAIVAGGVAGGAAAAGVQAAQTWALQKLGLLAEEGEKPQTLDKILADAPGPAEMGALATQLSAFYPGGQPELAKVLSRKLAGQVVTAAERKALTQAASRAAVSGGVGTAVQAGAAALQGAPMGGEELAKAFVQNMLMNKPGPLGAAAEAAGTRLGTRSVSPAPQPAEAPRMPQEPPAAQEAPGAAPAPEAAQAAPQAEAAPAPGEPPVPDRWARGPGEVLGHVLKRYPNDIRKAVSDLSEKMGGYQEAREAATPQQETARRAELAVSDLKVQLLAGATTEQILGKIPLNEAPAKTHALGLILEEFGKNVITAEQAQAKAPNDPLAALSLVEATARLNSVQETTAAAGSFLGRGLNILGTEIRGGKTYSSGQAPGRSAETAKEAARIRAKVESAKTPGQKRAAKQELDGFIRKQGGMERIQQRARMLNNAPEDAKMAVARNLFSGRSSRLFETYVAGLMTARTAVRNIVGGSLSHGGEHLALAVNALIPDSLGGTPKAELAARWRAHKQALGFIEKTLPEAVQVELRAKTMYQVFKNVWKLKQDFTMGAGSDAYDTGYQRSWGSYKAPDGPGLANKAKKALERLDKLGELAIMSNVDFMRATDAAAKAVAYNSQLAGVAARDAVKNLGLRKPEDIRQHVVAVLQDSLMEHPTMRYKSGDYETTFTDEARRFAKTTTFSMPSFGAEVLNKLGVVAPPVNWVVPFKLSPINLVKRAKAFSVFPLLPRALQAIGLPEGYMRPVAGGSNVFKDVAIGDIAEARRRGPEERNLAYARVAIGSAIMGGIYQAALNGDVTGAPDKDKSRQAVKYALGRPPYAFRAPGSRTFVTYRGNDPVSTLFATAATSAETIKRNGKLHEGYLDLAARLSIGFAAEFFGKPMARGPRDLLTVLGGEDTDAAVRTASNMARNAAATVAIPSGTLRDVAMAADDNTIRETKTLHDAVLARLPGERRELRQKRNPLTGEVIKKHFVGEDWFGPIAAILSPMEKYELRDDPLAQLILETDFGVGYAKDYAEAGGQRIPMTEPEYDRFLERSGFLFNQDATAAVPKLAKMDPAARKKELSKLMESAREQARNEVEATTRLKNLIEKAKRDARQVPR